jgi:hypothetical protein
MLFDSLVSSILKESPDVVADVYDRTVNDYSHFIFFIGDENGSFLKKSNPSPWGTETHSFIVANLKEEGIIIPQSPYSVLDSSLWTGEGRELLGNPRRISTKHSGIIMPQQSDMNGTYISFWYYNEYPKNCPALKQLFNYTKKNFPGPYFIDKAAPLAAEDVRSTVVPL